MVMSVMMSMIILLRNTYTRPLPVKYQLT